MNPSHAGSNHDYGLALLNEKRFQETEAHIERAMKMNPIGRRSYEGLLPIVYMAMANSDKSLEWCNIIYDRGSHSRYHGFRAAIFFHLGDIETAKTYLKKFREQRPEITTLEERPLHNLLFGFPLVMFFEKLPVFTLFGDCSVGFQALFLILVVLIQWVPGLAGRRAPGTLPPSRYYGRWLPGRTGLGF